VTPQGSAESSAIGRLDESDRSQSRSLIAQQLVCISNDLQKASTVFSQCELETVQ